MSDKALMKPRCLTCGALKGSERAVCSSCGAMPPMPGYPARPPRAVYVPPPSPVIRCQVCGAPMSYGQSACERCGAPGGKAPAKPVEKQPAAPAEPVRRPTLTRLSDGERFTIDRPSVSIGKDSESVDFCITENAAVSRHHADIICRDGKYFLTDNNSTNHTYLNGRQVPPMTEIRLSGGEIFMLADEKFLFEL